MTMSLKNNVRFDVACGGFKHQLDWLALERVPVHVTLESLQMSIDHRKLSIFQVVVNVSWPNQLILNARSFFCQGLYL